MALTLTVDTYITQTDCSAYLAKNYASTDPKLIAWTALSSDDKDVYLRKAVSVIDELPLIGTKVFLNQSMAFPRFMYSSIYELNDLSRIPLLPGLYAQTKVPDAVPNAQCELAITLAQGIPSRIELQRQGVTRFVLGNMQEMYSADQNAMAVVSHEALLLLEPYIARSCPIC